MLGEAPIRSTPQVTCRASELERPQCNCPVLGPFLLSLWITQLTAPGPTEAASPLGASEFRASRLVDVVPPLARCAPFCGIQFRAARNRSFPSPPPVGGDRSALWLVELSSLILSIRTQCLWRSGNVTIVPLCGTHFSTPLRLNPPPCFKQHPGQGRRFH